MSLRYCLLSLVLLYLPPALAGPVVLQSSEQRVSLLELYTSEGCNSCPPADRWLSGLRDDPRLWRELVPVAFHVDYWDRLGWPDRFGARAYSRRQRDYAAAGGLSQVYTPGFVLNGNEWRGWFRGGALDPGIAFRVGTLALRIDDDRARIHFQPIHRPAAALELHLVLLGFGIDNPIGAGENAGRTLTHDFIVLGHAAAALHADGNDYRGELPLPPTRDGLLARAAAAWISRAGEPGPLQAVGGWL